MFTKASDKPLDELEDRMRTLDGMLRYGVSYLDDALLGILSSDLVLLGAASGVGKTQLCCAIALTNILAGKRIHFIALEADEYEIERRIKFRILSRLYFDGQDLFLREPLTFARWRIGAFTNLLARLEVDAAERMLDFHNLNLFYKHGDFSVNNLIEAVISNADESDLFIIDHAHYFDFDGDNENRALKEIAKMTRTLSLENGVPIILVAHLRKRDRWNNELVPGIDEFHGSSDLAKIATRVITVAPGAPSSRGNFETFFRIAKNRLDAGTTRYIGQMFYNTQQGSYEDLYAIGAATANRDDGFESLPAGDVPGWATHVAAPRLGSGSDNDPQGPTPRAPAKPHWQETF